MGAETEKAIPKSGVIRREAQRILEELEPLDLAESIRDDNRLASYTPYIDLIKNGDHPKLYLRQLSEGILYELDRLNAKAELKHLHDQALKTLLK